MRTYELINEQSLVVATAEAETILEARDWFDIAFEGKFWMGYYDSHDEWKTQPVILRGLSNLGEN